MKAIKITKGNKAELTATYELSEGFLDYSSGLFLVAGFGNKQYEGLFTPAAFSVLFTRTGKELKNGFFEVEKKS